MSIQIELDPEAELIGKLIGLLDGNGDLQKSWFSNPWKDIEQVPRHLGPLLELIDVALGPAAEDGPPVFANASWYPVRNPSTGNPTGFCLVTPAKTASSGVVGTGVLKSIGFQSLTVSAYGFVPLLALSTQKDPVFVASQQPTQIGVRITSTTPFKGKRGDGKAFQFDALDLDALVVLADPPKPQKLELRFEGLKLDGKNASAKESTFTSFSAVLADLENIVEYVVAVLLQASYWLNTYLGQSSYTVGMLLEMAGILHLDPSTEIFSLDAAYLKNTPPEKIAEHFFFALLSSLSESKDPLIPVPGGGIYVAAKDDPKTQGIQHYGARVVVTDLTVGGGKKSDKAQQDGKAGPELKVQVGKWLAGEDDTNSWVSRSLGHSSKPDAPKPGVSVFLLSYDGKDVTFEPSFDFVSLGIDIQGGAKKPLFNVKGYVLSGLELRVYVTEDGGNFSFLGGAGSLDGLGVPLGPGFGSAVSGSQTNPVAQSLLKSDPSGGGSDKGKAVNPSFGVSFGYVDGGEVVAQLYDKKGQPADVVMIPIQRSVGPLECEKLGLGWVQDKRLLSLLFDGGVKVGTLDVDLVGLSIGVPVASPGDFSAYQLDLDGLGIDFTSGNIELSAALLRTKGKDYTQYDGEALVKAGTFSLSAVGSYAYVSKPQPGFASLFIFAMLDAELGDPTATGALFITGLAGGFGYNRNLVLPEQDGVQDFLLIAAASDPKVLGGEGAGPAEALAKLDPVIPPERGQYWLAAGLRFTSFDLINSTALFVVEFGKELEIAILGLSWISLPPPAAPGASAPAKKFAYGELGIEIKILPSEGLVSATAILTPNSFVIDPACKLTGGFAFYVWFDPSPHAGQFVLTLGGYHASFKPPSYFPKVPRLGFRWPMPGNVTISGQAYFALTPSAVMAGGGLQVLFHTGPLRAWFKAEMNALIQWAPFHYDITFGISIGVSVRVHVLFVTITLNVSLSADLQLIGPPMGGVAHVHFFIVSFTVRFGSKDNAAPAPLKWKNDDGTGFSQTLLPHKSPKPDDEQTPDALVLASKAADVSANGVYTVAVNDGLLRNFEKNGETIWIVRPNHFVFSVLSTIPCTQVTATPSDYPKKPGSDDKSTYKPGDCPNPAADGDQISLRPMKAVLSASELTVTLTDLDHKTDLGQPQVYDLPGEFDMEPAGADVPEAKWGTPLAVGNKEKPNYNKLLPSRLMGLKKIRPKEVSPLPQGADTLQVHVGTAFTYLAVDGEVPYHPFHLPLQKDAKPVNTAPQGQATPDLLQSSMMSAEAVAARGTTLQALQDFGLAPLVDGDLQHFAKDPGAYLLGDPLLAAAPSSSADPDAS